MARYVLRRLITSIFVLIAGLTLIFFIARVVPGDPARMAVGIDADLATVEQFRRENGLDRPLWEQYVVYASHLAQGDLGRSLTSRQPVADDLMKYWPATVELALASAVLFIALGILFGSIAAMTGSRSVDRIIRFLSLATYSLPPFWLGLVLQVVFYANLHALPAIGRIDPSVEVPWTITGLYVVDSLLEWNLDALGSSAKHLILPAATLVLGQTGLLVRMLRISVLEVKNRAYVTTAHAKGLSGGGVFRRHILRNALLPLLTMASIQLGWLLTGTVVIETIFGWPGLGRYAVSSISTFDYAPVMGVAIVTLLVFLMINLVVDLLYAVVDPRIRYSS